MTVKRKIAVSAMVALLVAGGFSFAPAIYAKSNKATTEQTNQAQQSAQETEEKKQAETQAKKAEAAGKDYVHSPDSDLRGLGDSATNKAKQKVTVCHVPKGNPANAHTINISINAWPAHRDNHGGDYLGSCNRQAKTITTKTNTATGKREETVTGNTSATAAIERQHVITGCTGTARQELMSKVQSYYEPIIVSDSTLDDPTVVTAMSQCLNNGDSSDSGNKKASKGQGKLEIHDSVSDSGKHKKTYHIIGCQNKDKAKKPDSSHKEGLSDSDKKRLTDSNKTDSNDNFHAKLKGADASYDKEHSIKDKIIVSDSSRDDSGVKKALKECASKDSGKGKKMDSAKTGKAKGDSGHKHLAIKHDSSGGCGSKLEDAVKQAKEKAKNDENKPIIIGESAFNDVAIQQAVEACTAQPTTKKQIKDEMTSTPIAADLTITNANITGVTASDVPVTSKDVENPTITGAIIENGTIKGTFDKDGTKGEVVGDSLTLTGGTLTAGTIPTDVSSDKGTITSGTITSGTPEPSSVKIVGLPITGGELAGGTVTGGSVSCSITGGTVTGGTVDSSSATIVGGKDNGDGTVTGTITGVNVSGGALTGASCSDSVITGGTLNGGTVNSAIVGGSSDANATKGRLNWRETSK